jgi:hypothetical protein
MLKKAFLLAGLALIVVTAASADIPIPPCAPCIVHTGLSR